MPDPVTDIEVVFANHDSLEIEWKQPDSNNAKITGYKVLLSEQCSNDLNGLKIVNSPAKMVAELPADQHVYRVTDLRASTGYHLTIVANSDIGEGYKAEPLFVMTQSEEFKKDRQLYVWGSNTYSELGLSDDLVRQHPKLY